MLTRLFTDEKHNVLLKEMFASFYQAAQKRGTYTQVYNVNPDITVYDYALCKEVKKQTLGIHDVQYRLNAVQKRETLMLIVNELLLTPFQYNDYILMCYEIPSDIARRLIYTYMSRESYWEDQQKKWTSLENWANSWVGKYSSGNGNGSRCCYSGVVQSWEYTQNHGQFCVWFHVLDSQYHKIHYQYKEMSQIGRAKLRAFKQAAESDK